MSTFETVQSLMYFLLPSFPLQNTCFVACLSNICFPPFFAIPLSVALVRVFAEAHPYAKLSLPSLGWFVHCPQLRCLPPSAAAYAITYIRKTSRDATHLFAAPPLRFVYAFRNQCETISMLIVPSQSTVTTEASNIGSRPAHYRHSLEMKSVDQKFAEGASDATATANNNAVLTNPPKLQGSFSANDVPTLKTVSGVAVGTTPNQAAQQHLHNHNASMGRIPAGAMPNRHSRELSSDGRDGVPNVGYQSIGSTLHASAAPFGPNMNQNNGHLQAPALTQAPPTPAMGANITNPQGLPSYSNGYYPANGYNNAGPGGPTGVASAGYPGVPMLSMQMQGMNLNAANGYSPANYNGYAPVYASPQPRDSQARVIQSRRQQDSEGNILATSPHAFIANIVSAMSRFSGQSLEAYGGSIYELCKDQHGCRFLQKQLENRNPDQVHMIWLETCSHVIELMTDPFGNYLCQKLFEYCNDDERTVLVQNAAKDMVRIALNQHGTRALQKMIEHLSNQDQVQLIIGALDGRVVELIQDLNGNHVVQKCLNKLSSLDAQFIFDAVGNSCVEVGTHRHGCCVLQRCIDHASGDQKIILIQRITEHAVTLVQDPFGNYVVQYIIDLNELMFTEPAVQKFRGRIAQLSRHKFSSNVIEKCLRCASDQSKDLIVEELLAPGEMERLIRDSYANYVVQTALEHATTHMKKQMVEAIRPILPSVRQTPYGRKIQAKVTAYDSAGGRPAPQMTGADQNQAQMPMRPIQLRGITNTSILSPAYQNGINGINGRGHQTFPSSATLTVPPPQAPQRGQQHYIPPPQQYANRIAGAPYAKGNGAPISNGGTPNGMNPPAIGENGDAGFF